MRGLTILFVPNDGNENISSCQVLAEELEARGHRIVFVVDMASKGLLVSHGFEEEIRDPNISDQMKTNILKVNFDASKFTAIQRVKHFCYEDIIKKFKNNKDRESYYELLIERVKPDILIIESMICSPALINCGIPWVWLNFGSPNLCLNTGTIPPAWSGLPINGKQQHWDAFKEEWNDLFKNIWTDLNQWCLSRGSPELPENAFHPHSPYLNIYVYPKELDLKVIETWPLSKTWVQLDCLTKSTNNKFSVPEQLRGKPGKLIYLNMGPFADLQLMKRLTDILADSQNRFIVSKGVFDDEYELPENMWGLESLPQTDIIPTVDLVITSGDNKTILEAFYFTKPLIVMPLFGDQLDNGQRVKENAFGLTLDPYSCSRATTLCLIESMLDDHLLTRRMSMISHRMQNSDAAKLASLKIEKIFDL